MNKIVKIKISEIDDFKNHPYRVELGDELNTLVESVKLNGLLVTIVVRKKEDNRYELLSGHRRKKVYQILDLKEIDAIVKDKTFGEIESNNFLEYNVNKVIENYNDFKEEKYGIKKDSKRYLAK